MKFVQSADGKMTLYSRLILILLAGQTPQV